MVRRLRNSIIVLGSPQLASAGATGQRPPPMPPNGGACRRSGSCNGAAWASAAPGNPARSPERPVEAPRVFPHAEGCQGRRIVAPGAASAAV